MSLGQRAPMSQGHRAPNIINYTDELWISKIYDNKKYYKKYYLSLINILNSQYFNNINYKIYILYNYNKNKNKLNFEKLYINNFFIHYNYLIKHIYLFNN